MGCAGFVLLRGGKRLYLRAGYAISPVSLPFVRPVGGVLRYA